MHAESSNVEGQKKAGMQAEVKAEPDVLAVQVKAEANTLALEVKAEPKLSSTQKFKNMPCAAWDFKHKFAKMFDDGQQITTQHVYPLEPLRKSASPVAAVFENGIVARVAMIWWGAIQPADFVAPGPKVFRNLKVML